MLDEIPNEDRRKFISKCNKLDNQLEMILKNHLTKLDKKQLTVLTEKKQYVNSIKDIVNDLEFQNKSQFTQLYKVLKEIQEDVKKQNKTVSLLDNSQSKDELVNMLIQRMIYDSSKKTLEQPKALEKLGITNDEEQLKLLEKYIIRVVKKELEKELTDTIKKNQEMNVIDSTQIKKRLDLIESTVNKLGSMESLYEKIHSNNSEQKKRIITFVKEPVKKALVPFNLVCPRPISKKKRVGANTILVDDDLNEKELNKIIQEKNMDINMD